MITRRSAFAVFAAAFAAPIAAMAQPGRLPSSTAPSNSEGTPAGGPTGTIATTQVPAAGGTPAPARTHRRRQRAARRHSKTIAQ